MITSYYILIIIVTIILVTINTIISVYKPYSDKVGTYECGYTGFSQTRTSFPISFILIAILFLPFDLEISSILPYTITMYNTSTIGIYTIIVFTLLLCIGFYYEYNRKALVIPKTHIKNTEYQYQYDITK
uniref:NADH-ubiquinone oxidoreductase chain 3 n=1 Tax=Diddensiella santjacobensis TaxID=2704139 RepID=S5TMU2_9ASCO|nr:NADH dehydrogenase subunit 3 [Diddensiella santjacobensis]AGS44135.1 NADH dehydrogenase subunit 3 [Diddensiella santjacobensis]